MGVFMKQTGLFAKSLGHLAIGATSVAVEGIVGQLVSWYAPETTASWCKVVEETRKAAVARSKTATERMKRLSDMDKD